MAQAFVAPRRTTRSWTLSGRLSKAAGSAAVFVLRCLAAVTDSLDVEAQLRYDRLNEEARRWWLKL